MPLCTDWAALGATSLAAIAVLQLAFRRALLLDPEVEISCDPEGAKLVRSARLQSPPIMLRLWLPLVAANTGFARATGSVSGGHATPGSSGVSHNVFTHEENLRACRQISRNQVCGNCNCPVAPHCLVPTSTEDARLRAVCRISSPSRTT